MTEEKPKPLVSIERQFETDVTTGNTQVRMFVKMYFEARDSGLLADIGDVRWRTLCCLSTYMDAQGRCSPSQARLARDLGISRQQANQRIQALAAYRFQGRPVVRIEKSRRSSERGQRWANNVYFIQPISGLGIFSDRRSADGGARTPMSRKADIGSAVSASPVSGTPDINKSQIQNEIHTPDRVSHDFSGRESEAHAEQLVRLFHARRGHSPNRKPRPQEVQQARALIEEHGLGTARGILEFALTCAERTRFEMEHFGAVLSYAAEAIESERRSRSRRERKACPRSSSDFEVWRRRQIEKARENLNASELEALEEAVRAELLDEFDGEETLGFGLLFRSRVDALIALDCGIDRKAFRRQLDSRSSSGSSESSVHMGDATLRRRVGSA